MTTSGTTRDADILRKLGEETYAIGNLPAQQEKAELWRLWRWGAIAMEEAEKRA